MSVPSARLTRVARNLPTAPDINLLGAAPPNPRVVHCLIWFFIYIPCLCLWHSCSQAHNYTYGTGHKLVGGCTPKSPHHLLLNLLFLFTSHVHAFTMGCKQAHNLTYSTGHKLVGGCAPKSLLLHAKAIKGCLKQLLLTMPHSSLFITHSLKLHSKSYQTLALSLSILLSYLIHIPQSL